MAPWRSLWMRPWVSGARETFIFTDIQTYGVYLNVLFWCVGPWHILLEAGGHRELAVWRRRGPAETSVHRQADWTQGPDASQGNALNPLRKTGDWQGFDPLITRDTTLLYCYHRKMIFRVQVFWFILSR